MDRFAWVMLDWALAVGVGVGLAVQIIRLLVERIRRRSFARTVGWPAVAAWALGFALAAFSAAAFSIVLIALPCAVVVCAVVAWRCRALPEGAIGAGFGTGIVLLVVGLMNPTPTPCAIAIYGGDPRYCGIDGTSWLPLAIALLVIAAAGQMLIARRKHGAAHTNGAPSPT